MRNRWIRSTSTSPSSPSEGHSAFTIPVNDEQVQVDYLAAAGKHTVSIGKTAVEFSVHPLGEGEVRVVIWGSDVE